MLALLTLLVSPAHAETANTLAQQMSAAWAQLRGYRTHQTIQERVNGTLGPEQAVRVAFRKPWEIQLEWDTVHPGRKVYWCATRHAGEIQVYPGGLAGRAVGVLSFALDNRIIKQDTNYTPANGGFGYLVETIAKALVPGSANPPVASTPVEGTTGGERSWTVVLEKLQNPRYNKAEVRLSQSTHLPLEYTAWQSDGALAEHYTWRDTVLDPTFQDTLDFDVGYR